MYIAERCPDLDSNKAHILGLLHDIGRRVGIVSLRHIWEGYQYAMHSGWDEAAKICLTHSFPTQKIHEDVQKDDLTDSEREHIVNFLNQITYDDYDKLIILCDSLATAEGFCLLEKRWVDVSLRYGFSPFTIKRWEKTL
ncbi:MAG: hypothetical protein ACOX60_01730 [Massiliimalia sp.]